MDPGVFVTQLQETLQNQSHRSHLKSSSAPSHHNSFSTLYLWPSLRCPSITTDHTESSDSEIMKQKHQTSSQTAELFDWLYYLCQYSTRVYINDAVWPLLLKWVLCDCPSCILVARLPICKWPRHTCSWLYDSEVSSHYGGRKCIGIISKAHTMTELRCGMACMLNTPKRVSSLVNGFSSWLLLEILSLLLHALSAFMVQRSYLFQLIDFSAWALSCMLLQFVFWVFVRNPEWG